MSHHVEIVARAHQFVRVHLGGQQAGLRMLPCPVAMPGYAIEMGWRADALRDEAVAAVRRCVLGLLEGFDWTDCAPRPGAGHLRP